MDTLEKLNQWLEKPVYEAGVMLYSELIGAGFILTMLKTGADDYNRQRLYEALLQRRDEMQLARQALAEQYPDELKQSLDEAGLLMDERIALKERMRVIFNRGITEGVELEECAFRIKALGESLDAIYGRQDFFEQHGYLPEAAVIDAQLTPAQVYKRQLTVRTYVSRDAKRLRSMPIDSEAFQTLRKRLSAYQTELHCLDQQLLAMMPSHVPLQN